MLNRDLGNGNIASMFLASTARPLICTKKHRLARSEHICIVCRPLRPVKCLHGGVSVTLRTAARYSTTHPSSRSGGKKEPNALHSSIMVTKRKGVIATGISPPFTSLLAKQKRVVAPNQKRECKAKSRTGCLTCKTRRVVRALFSSLLCLETVPLINIRNVTSAGHFVCVVKRPSSIVKGFPCL